MEIVLIIGIMLLGMIMGSFAGAQIWRIRARQLSADVQREKQLYSKKKRTADEDEEYNELLKENITAKAERAKLTPLLEQKVHKDRSRCLSCGHELRWYDLLPIVSWMSLGGKCRYCQAPIGWTELLLEVSLAVLFVGSVCWWGSFDIFGIVQLIVWLIALVLLAILFVYDARWFLLPDMINWAFVAAGAMFAGLHIYQSTDVLSALISLGGAVGILSGLYLLLYVISRGRWIGFGDVKLGLGLGLFLGDWLLALLALFLANLIGTFFVLPGMLRGTLRKETRIPFGPLLILGFLISLFAGQYILSWYMLFI